MKTRIAALERGVAEIERRLAEIERRLDAEEHPIDVRAIREQAGMKQEEFAAALGMSRQQVSRLEHGHSFPPPNTRKRLLALAREHTKA